MSKVYVGGWIDKEDHIYLIEEMVNVSKVINVLIGKYVESKKQMLKAAQPIAEVANESVN